jgi:phosphoribosylformylglycinamidine synthase
MIAAKNDTDLANLAATHRFVANTIASGKVSACHDISDGGIAVAAAEMCIASGLGLIVGAGIFDTTSAFEERPGRYLLELTEPTCVDELRQTGRNIVDITDIGLVQHLQKLTLTTEKERILELSLDEMTAAWRGTLDW